MTATANDILLQNVTVIPLEVATPVPSTEPTAKPALTTASGLPPAGEEFTATKQRRDFNKLVAAVFLAVAIVLIVARLFGVVAVKARSAARDGRGDRRHRARPVAARGALAEPAGDVLPDRHPAGARRRWPISA